MQHKIIITITLNATSLVMLLITGCANTFTTATAHHNKTPSKTMMEIYQQHRSGNHENKMQQYTIDTTNENSKALNKTKTLSVEQLQDFELLPNPAILLYVYPHFAGSEQLPIPGYYTVFGLYQRGYFLLR
jgi:conjugative transfer region lipoprotein (TIGR03751 family)